jgi:ABC-type uncharacterized transport system auxiliary subunit
MKLSTLLIVAPLALAASGCIRLLPKPPPPPLIFSLDAAPLAQPLAAIPKNVVIAVATPDATRALSGDDIAWRKDGLLAYVDGVTWEGRQLDLLQDLLVHTIDRRGFARGAVRLGEGTANAELHWDLLAFEIEENGGDVQAHIQVNAKLFDSRTRMLIAAREFDEHVPVSDRASSVAARALETVAQNASAKIGDWAVEQAKEQDLPRGQVPTLRGG